MQTIPDRSAVFVDKLACNFGQPETGFVYQKAYALGTLPSSRGRS